MNILICTFSFPAQQIKHFGGKFVLGEAIAYAENGANVRVLTPWLQGGEEKEQIGQKISVLRFNYFWPKALQKLVKCNEPIYKRNSLLSFCQIPFLFVSFFIHIFKNAYWADIIHAQWTLTALLALPSKWILGKRIVMTARGSDIRLLPKWLNQFIHFCVDGAIDCFGPQPWNVMYKSKFRANYLKLPLIVHNDSNGIIPEDVKKEIGNKTDVFTILYVGRFDNIKIHDSKLPILDLIYACKYIRKNSNNFHIFYIGDGELCQEIIDLIKKWKVDKFVTLLGPKNNVFDYIEACHLGVGGVAFNAVSEEFTIASKPQILMRGEENAKTPWIDRVNSIFVEPNDISDLAEKISWSILNREKIKEIGKTATIDMREYITDIKNGGRIYLERFCNL